MLKFSLTFIILILPVFFFYWLFLPVLIVYYQLSNRFNVFLKTTTIYMPVVFLFTFFVLNPFCYWFDPKFIDTIYQCCDLAFNWIN